MKPPFELEQFQKRSLTKKFYPPNNQTLPQPGQRERFLKGPIPWRWFACAAKQRGRSLQTALAIWHIGQLTKSAVVQIRPSLLRELGIGRNAYYRSLKVLEGVGLIRFIERRVGKCPVVLILEHIEVLTNSSNTKKNDFIGPDQLAESPLNSIPQNISLIISKGANHVD